MKKVIISYKRLPVIVRKAIKSAFPLGIENELQSIKNVITGKFFEGLIYEFDNITYLIKTDDYNHSVDSNDSDILFDNEDSFNEEY